MLKSKKNIPIKNAWLVALNMAINKNCRKFCLRFVIIPVAGSAVSYIQVEQNYQTDKENAEVVDVEKAGRGVHISINCITFESIKILK